MSERFPSEEPPDGALPAPPNAAPDEPPQTAATTPSPEPEPAKKGVLGRVVLIAVVLIAVLAIAGGAAAYFLMRGAPETVLDKIPSGADVVVIGHLDPAASQKMNLFRMAEKFPDLGSREELTQKLNGLLDESLADAGLDHQDLDWVGGEVGGYVDVGAAQSFAVLLAADDEGAAADALQALRDNSGTTYTTSTIEGVDVSVPADSSEPATAIVDSVVVVASSEDTMRSVILTAHGGSSVETDEVFTGVMDRLPDDNLGFAYVNIENLVGLLAALPTDTGLGTSLQALGATRGIGVALSAESDGIVLDTTMTTDPSRLTDEQRAALATAHDPNALLSLTPADAMAVFAYSGITKGFAQSAEQLAQLDPSTARTIEKLDLVGPGGVLQHLSGDLAWELGPGSGLIPVSGTVMVGVDDAEAVNAWMSKHVPDLLADTPLGSTGALKTEEYQGVEITYGALPGVPVAWGVVDDALVVGISSDAVEQAVDLSANGGGITTDPDYTAATAGLPGTASVAYLDVKGVLDTVRGLLPADAYQEFLDAGGRDLEPITTVVAGQSTDENGSDGELKVTIP